MSSAHPRPALHVDGVLVINLIHRPERLEHFRANADAQACLRHWERLPAVNGQLLSGYGQPPWFRHGNRDKSWGGRAGCALSHRNAISIARERGWRSVLIFEDDVILGPDFDHELQTLLSTLETSAQGWHACFLGVSQPVGPGHPLASLGATQQLFQIQGCLGAFAYILKAELYDWALARLPNETNIWPWLARHRAIDRWYARNLSPNFKITAVSPSLVGHYTSFSDIGQRAGAVISKDGAEADHSQPIIGRHSAICGLSRRTFQLYFLLADQANRLRAWHKRRKGF